MKFFLRILSILSLAAFSPAWADRARAPYDYAQSVAGGKYEFVMLATRSHSLLDPGEPDDVGVIDTNKELRRKYSSSGLYVAGKRAPLWTVSWYAFDTYPSSDGEHVVRMGPWASSTKQLAVAFYSKGNEIRRYLIGDLVKGIDKLRHTVSHFFWMEKCEIDDRLGLFRIRTVDGIDYTFAISTGEVVSMIEPPPNPDNRH